MNTSALDEVLSRNSRQILAAIEAACQRAGRTGPLPRLIAVTKYVPLPWVEALLRIGMRDFGESRPQQLKERAEHFAPDPAGTEIRWHLIGQLQRNKVRQALQTKACIHSVDSLKLLQTIERLAEELTQPASVLLQVNISGEASKSGFQPEQLLQISSQLTSFRHIKILGLMTMAPETTEVAVLHHVFGQLRLFRDDLKRQLPESLPLTELSMGMSGDFEIAVEEGATMVRVGSRLFENCETVA